ncbi:MAG TPA: aminoacyl-tRNA hydrolase [Syntrophobacteria bacterium]|nr:aminoacyl-tRNA hydrolase [Syntrophobacteria bacterium]
MYLVVGLGNPGEVYRLTRHNLGFLVVDHLATDYGIRLMRKRAGSLWGRGAIVGHPVILVKPQTFMNRSGEAVAALMGYFSLSPEHLVVIQDDLDLEFGRVRLVHGGGTGGHRGVDSIHDTLGVTQYVRLKIGIDRPGHGESAERYVLSPWSEDQWIEVPRVVARAAAAITKLLTDGLDKAMTVINAKPIPQSLT